MKLNKRGDGWALKLAFLAIIFMIFFFMIIGTFFNQIIEFLGMAQYEADSSQLDVCYNLWDETTENILFSVLLLDEDDDTLADNICDTCICRDGYGGKICALLNRGVSNDNLVDLAFRKLFGIDLNDDSVLLPECKRKKIFDRSCSTDNAKGPDLDSDFLPNICDGNMERFERKPACFKGPITTPTGFTIGYGHGEEIKGSDKAHCVITLCTDKSIMYDSYRLFEKYCDRYIKIENNDLVVYDDVHNLVEYFKG